MRVAILCLLAACNSGGLGVGSGGNGSDGGALDLAQAPDGGGCIGQCELMACDSLTDATACDQRSDCFALWSGDLPCNNTSCQNHFVRCQSAPPVCSGSGTCNGSCAQLTPTCRSGDVPVFASASQACCAIGCVAGIKCPIVNAGCSSDAECGAGAYCRGLLMRCSSMCQLALGTAATGMCHRSCVGGACSCADDSDCPGAFTSCDLSTGKCKTIAPPVCHANCPSQCTDSTDAQYGEICICPSC
jgi:hypothetical protein